MKLFNNLPLYEAVIANENCGLFKTSFVSDPATEVNWVAFDENTPIVKFSVDNKVERMVSGVLMLADSPIYRRTADNYEYYVVYSKETLKQMAEKMIFDGVGSNVNIQHQDGSDVDGVNLVELYVIDREKGVAPVAFENVPDGSLIGTYKVHNDDVWNMIENGDVLSFSLEGVFQMEETFNRQDNNKKENNRIMSKLQRIKEVLMSLLVEFSEVSTDKGVVIFDGDELAEGMDVHGIDEQGNDVQLEDGEYTTEDGKIITIESGKVKSIVDKEAEVAPEEAPVEEEPKEDEPKEDEPKEDEAPVDEAPEEEKPEEETPEEAPAEDETPSEVDELKNRIKELEDENAQLKERIAELEKEPSAMSAEEAFATLSEKTEHETKADKLRQKGYRF